MYIGSESKEKAKEKREEHSAQSGASLLQIMQKIANKTDDKSHKDGIISKIVKATTSVYFTVIVALFFLFYSE